MAAPPHPTVFNSGPGKTFALVPGGGSQVQPIHLLQNAPQPSVTMVRVVTHAPSSSNPPNGYSAPTVGGVESNNDIRGTVLVIYLIFMQPYVNKRGTAKVLFLFGSMS